MKMDMPSTYHLEGSIFKDNNQFNNYEGINGDRIKEIYNLAMNFRNTNFKGNKLQYYNFLLQYLKSSNCRFSNNPNVKNHIFNSYDEVMLFYVFATDENLLAYKNSLFIKDKKEQQNKTRSDIGFFNTYILRYERVLFLLTQDKLVTGIQSDFSLHLKVLLQSGCCFSLIRKKRFEELDLLASKWRENQEEGTLVNTWLYNIYYQPNLLSFNNSTEKIIFFMRCIDPEYKLLQILENVSTIEKLKKELIEKFGFYNENFIGYEKRCHKIFNPEITIDKWDEKKM
jgi:hypothetical protein